MILARTDPLIQAGFLKPCKECTNFVAETRECMALQRLAVDFVMGTSSPVYDKCADMRAGLCGPEGSLFANEIAVSVDPIKVP